MRAGLDDYLRLIADHPVKFTAEQVAFDPLRGARLGMPCRECIHWFLNPRRSETVCEIFRHADAHNVEAPGNCRFWTPDGKVFPMLDQV